MLSGQVLDRLEAHQDRIATLIAEARVAVREPWAGAREELARVRRQMLHVMREYQIFKHGEIFDPIIASSDPSRIAAARRLKASCIITGEQYSRHTLRWSSRGIEGEWQAYTVALEEICRTIERHLADERHLVALLLEGAEPTRHG